MLKRSQLFYGAALAAILGGGSVAWSQDAPSEADALFTKLDKNGDGKLTKDEIPEEQTRFFERLVRLGDKDNDGSLTKDEFQQANKPEEKPNVPLGPAVGGEGGRGMDPRQRFEMLDRNKDGKVTLDELPEQARERMKPLFDRLGKTEITADDLAKFPGPGGFGGPRPDPKETFKQFDKNNDGKLTKDELPEPMQNVIGPLFERLGKTELTQDDWVNAANRFMAQQGGRGGQQPNPEALFKQFDANGDGKLTKDELPAELRERMAQAFDRAEKNELTQDEFARSFAQTRGPRDGRPGQPMEGRRPEGAAAERRPEGDRNPAGARTPEGERGPDARRPDGEARVGDRNPEGRRPEGDRPQEGGRRMESMRGPALVRKLDKNNDGRISKDELAAVVSLFDELDTNHDGQLDPAELIGGPMGPPRDGEGRRNGDAGGNARRPEGEARPDSERRTDRPAAENGRGGDRPQPARGTGAERRPDQTRGDGNEPSRERPQARGDGPRDGEAGFGRLDKNGDGKISKDEVPEHLAAGFGKLDTNGDGFLSPEEFRVLAAPAGDRTRERRPEAEGNRSR